jgi:hypothetical protein
MKTVAGRVFKRFDRAAIEREIDEELRLHLEMLMWEHLQQDMSPAEAREAALKRFGNVEQIKDQCVEISKRSNLFVRALKSLLTLMFLAGVLIRVFSAEFHVMRVGEMLMIISVMSHLFLYLRSWQPSDFRHRSENLSPLMLSEKTRTPIAPYDQRMLTPIERVISGK